MDQLSTLMLFSANRVVAITGCLFALMLTLCGTACLCHAQSNQTHRAEGRCIDLAQYFNAQMTNSLNSPSFVKENNLASMPTGRQILAGVPFQVSGVVQLAGKKVQEWGRDEFPEAVNGLPMGAKFKQFHVLHGAGGVYDEDGTTIAKLVHCNI